MATQTPITPGVSSFPVPVGAHVRMTGGAPATLTDADIASALSSVGLSSPRIYSQGAPLPADWPTEGRPPLFSGQRAFRAEGIWSKANALPATIRLPSGTVLVFQAWTVTGASLASATDTPSSTGNDADIRRAMIAGSAVLAGGIFLAGLALILRDKNKVAAPMLRRNPVAYHSTTHYRGVPIHVNSIDGFKYCADYSAIERYTVFGEGGMVCERTPEKALVAARRKIEHLLG
jgi:hypothetical protein